MNFNKILITGCIIGALACLYFAFNTKDKSVITQKPEIQQNIKNNEFVNTTQNKNYDVAEKYKNADSVNITVNYPVSLSYKTKKAVFDLRKRYISESIFENKDYEPSEYVFGQIEDNKPWMSIYLCEDKDAKEHSINGPSEESRFILNPTVLVALEYPFFITDSDYEWCHSNEAIMLPKSVSYSGKNNEITVTYISLPIVIQNNSFYQFNGINAKDLGYKSFYIDKEKSTYIPEFTNTNNPLTEIQEFNNFIHLGSSCKHPGGCNNGSPRQPSLEFKYKSEKYTRHNESIYIKLWKERPDSPNSQADINEKIIIANI